jgi:molecular chaperone DnaK
MRVIGIDAGTTRFKTAILTTSGEPQTLTNRVGETFTPSAVYFAEDGTILIGTEAVNAALADPKRAVFDWKVNMGTDKVLYADGKTSYTAKDILTILLENVKTDAEAKIGEPVQEAVITVPANYSNAQKQQTQEAAEKAGIKVILTPHEPTAGAIGNNIYKLKDATVVVYDLGGGTFDVSILKVRGHVCEVISTGGIQQLGGRDFNNRIKKYILTEFEKQHGYCPDPNEHAVFHQDLANRVEQVKINLSSQKQCNVVLSCNGEILNMPITREQLESRVSDLVEQTIKQMEATLQEAELTWGDIDALYPIGGGSMMPLVIRRLEEVSGQKPILNCEAHCAAALGAAVAGRLEYQRQNIPYQVGTRTLPSIKDRYNEILSRAIGVMALDNDDREVCCEILGKKTPVPSIQDQMFNLSRPNQTDARIQILQGQEGDEANECVALGHFELNNLPPRADVVGRIEITFDLDANGLLIAAARDTVSNRRAELKIDYNEAQQQGV